MGAGGCSADGTLRQPGLAPVPCEINSGVFLVRNSAAGRALVRAWHEGSQHPDVREQGRLNDLKRAHAHRGQIEIVGAQVFNTPTSFHSWMRASADPEATYGLSFWLSTEAQHWLARGQHQKGGPEATRRIESQLVDLGLNASEYRRAALEGYGVPMGSSDLMGWLLSAPGACARDEDAFICHAFGMPGTWKELMMRMVAREHRPTLDARLAARHQRYLTVSEAHRV